MRYKLLGRSGLMVSELCMGGTFVEDLGGVHRKWRAESCRKRERNNNGGEFIAMVPQYAHAGDAARGVAAQAVSFYGSV